MTLDQTIETLSVKQKVQIYTQNVRTLQEYAYRSYLCGICNQPIRSRQWAGLAKELSDLTFAQYCELVNQHGLDANKLKTVC